jgi:hypothetical protein
MSVRARDGTLVETVHRPEQGECRLVTLRGDISAEHSSITVDGREYVPYSADNNLLTHRVIVLPSAVAAYESEAALARDVQGFIHRYVDLSPGFEEIAAHYVLLTWGYDVFNELPYLRVRGQWGSGKSRFLLTVGALCFKPIFASGASTVSPLFRLIDQIGGTLVVDEADFWASDERAEIIKILNSGNAKGFPVLRSEVTPQKEFNPRAFNIFGPKLVATRHPFEDAALESRCLTEVLGGKALRRDIPISLPQRFHVEADALRNKLLMYRFRRFGELRDPGLPTNLGLEPRRAQIFAPLLSVAVSADARSRILAFANGNVQSTTDRDWQAEKRVLDSAKALLLDTTAPLTIRAIAERFDQDWRAAYGVDVTHRWVGSVLRRLGVEPKKSNGVYVVPVSGFPRLRELFSEYEVGDERDIGDLETTSADADADGVATEPC